MRCDTLHDVGARPLHGLSPLAERGGVRSVRAVLSRSGNRLGKVKWMIATKVMRFQGKNRDLVQLTQQIETTLQSQGYKTQSAEVPSGRVIQARKGGILSDIITAERAFTILLTGRLLHPHRHRETRSEPRRDGSRVDPALVVVPRGRCSRDALDPARGEGTGRRDPATCPIGGSAPPTLPKR